MRKEHMNSILKLLSALLFVSTATCFGQLLIPEMPLSQASSPLGSSTPTFQSTFPVQQPVFGTAPQPTFSSAAQPSFGAIQPQALPVAQQPMATPVQQFGQPAKLPTPATFPQPATPISQPQQFSSFQPPQFLSQPIQNKQPAPINLMPQPQTRPLLPVAQTQPLPLQAQKPVQSFSPPQQPQPIQQRFGQPSTLQPQQRITPAAPVFQPVPLAPAQQPLMAPNQFRAPQAQFPTQNLPTLPGTPQPTATVADKKPAEQSESEDKNKKDIYLNFENSDLASFVNYMAERKNMNLITDATLDAAKISLTIREPLSLEGAWNIFLTILDTAGFAIVQAGDVWKVQPKDKKFTQPLPSYVNVPADNIPDNDITIRYVFFLTNIQVADIQPVLESMLSQPNVLVPLPQLNAFVITDKSLNIKSAVKLIQELDQQGLPEEVTVLHLKRANAVDVKALLDALIVSKEVNPIARLLGKVTEGTTSYFSPSTHVVPEERTNSLILLGKKESNDKIIDFITNQIDTELIATKSPLHIYELQYADATAVMDILKTVTAPPESATGQQASKYGSIRGGVKYFKAMNFKVDKDGNRLIVSSTDEQDWALLEKTIADLDKPQPQVAIETLIVLVSVADTKELGGAMRIKKHGQIGINTDFQASTLGVPQLETDKDSSVVSLLGNMFNQVALDQGAAVLSFGKDTNIWSAFKVLKQLTNASILSQPSITVANKTLATIEIGKEIRVTQAIAQASGGTPLTSMEPAKATTILNITPQINPEGLVRLDIDLRVDDFTDGTGTARTLKNVKTNVTVADGQVLVLGGFVQTKTTEETKKVPLLGDLPLLGWFFKDQKRTVNKEYTFVFMAPTIIKPRQAPGTGLYTKMKFHQATDEIENAIETKRVKDPIHNWFFNPDKENYSHKVIDFANARYQPTTVDIKTDPYYRSNIDQHSDRSTRTAELSLPTQTKLLEQKLDAVPMYQTDSTMQALAQEPASPPNMPAPEQQPQLQRDAPMTTPQQQPAPITPTAAPMAQTSEQQTFTELDREIEQRRNELRARLEEQQARPPQMSAPTLQEKRKTLRDFLSHTPSMHQEEPAGNEEFEKRNRLKDFLAKNPAIALNDAGSHLNKREQL